MVINLVNNLEMIDKVDVSKFLVKCWVYVIFVVVIMYMLVYFDWINMVMILLYINLDIFSQIYFIKVDEGIVSGIFFFGYMFLQILVVIFVECWSVKKIVVIFMFFWGFVVMVVFFVQFNGQFYIV